MRLWALFGASLVAQMVKNLPAMWGIQVRSLGLGRSPGEGKSCLFQYSCLENATDRGAWWASVHEVSPSQMWLSNFHFTWHLGRGFLWGPRIQSLLSSCKGESRLNSGGIGRITHQTLKSAHLLAESGPVSAWRSWAFPAASQLWQLLFTSKNGLHFPGQISWMC